MVSLQVWTYSEGGGKNKIFIKVYLLYNQESKSPHSLSHQCQSTCSREMLVAWSSLIAERIGATQINISRRAACGVLLRPAGVFSPASGWYAYWPRFLPCVSHTFSYPLEQDNARKG